VLRFKLLVFLLFSFPFLFEFAFNKFERKILLSLNFSPESFWKTWKRSFPQNHFFGENKKEKNYDLFFSSWPPFMQNSQMIKFASQRKKEKWGIFLQFFVGRNFVHFSFFIFRDIFFQISFLSRIHFLAPHFFWKDIPEYLEKTKLERSVCFEYFSYILNIK